MKQIRILLVDDHSLFRESLSRLLEAEPDFRIAGTCASAAEALDSAASASRSTSCCSITIWATNRAGVSRRSEAPRFRGPHPDGHGGHDRSGTLRAFEAGSAGVFLKHSPPGQLVEAIHKVRDGELWLDSRAVRSLVAAFA